MILKLDSGKGPIKKSDFRRELKSGQHRPEIYTRDELKMLLEAMTSEEKLLFEVFLKTGFRKREVIFLEEDDLIVNTLAPGRVKRQIRCTNKLKLSFMTKNGKSRFLPIDRDLYVRSINRKKVSSSPSRDLSGKGIDRSTTYLEKVAGLHGLKTFREWDDLKAVQRIRNVIAHDDGKLRDRQGKFRNGIIGDMKRVGGLSGEDEIIVAEGFLSKVVDSCGNYFKLIAKSGATLEKQWLRIQSHVPLDRAIQRLA